MYMERKYDLECGKCGAINSFERIQRFNTAGIKCTECGHEKIYSEMTVTENKRIINFTLPDPPDKEIF